METCSLNDFMKEIKPWLDKEYIKEVFLDEKNHFVLKFNDGTQNVYQIDDCNESQVDSVLTDLEKKGIPVTK